MYRYVIGAALSAAVIAVIAVDKPFEKEESLMKRKKKAAPKRKAKTLSKSIIPNLNQLAAELVMGWEERLSDSMGDHYVSVSKSGSEEAICLIAEWNPACDAAHALVVCNHVLSELRSSGEGHASMITHVSEKGYTVTFMAYSVLEVGHGFGETLLMAMTQAAVSVALRKKYSNGMKVEGNVLLWGE